MSDASILVRMQADLAAAMKAQDAGTLSTLRMLKAALMEAKTRNSREASLSADEEIEVLQRYVKKRRETIEELEKGKTSVVIAHRLSTVRNADTIVVLKEGRIVEIGAHDALLRNTQGEYFRLYQLQFAERTAVASRLGALFKVYGLAPPPAFLAVRSATASLASKPLAAL